MVANIGVGQAATQVTESLKQSGSQGAGSKGSGAGNAEDFEKLLDQGAQGGANAANGGAQAVNASQGVASSGNVTSVNPASPATGADQGSTAPMDHVTLDQTSSPVSSTKNVSPGDKLLQSIDKMRSDGKQLLNSTQGTASPASNAVGAAPQTENNGMNLMKTVQQAQHEVTKLEVGTTILSKGVQSFDQDVQTLIKGGS